MRIKVSIRHVKSIQALDVDFDFPDSNILVVTGKNGVGKTTIIQSFGLIKDPGVFRKISGENSVSVRSQVSFDLSEFERFTFSYNDKLGGLDTRDKLPPISAVVSELPIPYGARFQHFSKIAGVDSELRVNIASSNYETPDTLVSFMSSIYSSDKFSELKSTKIGKDTYYFILQDDDYYLREDHFSSGEFFLIQLYRLVSSRAKIILIDELDVALDAATQVKLYSAITPILHSYGSRLIMVSHSLALMETVSDQGLYYLEESAGVVSLTPRSYGYVKSDLFGFVGFDKYILTEDEVLEGFIEFIIKFFPINVYYQHKTIGVGGVNQLEMLIKKNDVDCIFSSSDNVLCVVDQDVYGHIRETYEGPTNIVSSQVDDLEKYVCLNRERLLPEVSLPDYIESATEKRASKTYWTWLVQKKHISENELYRIIVESKTEDVKKLLREIKVFLEK